MDEKKSNDSSEILRCPYWSFSEIVDFAVFKKFTDDGGSDEAEAVLQFKADFLGDLREAIHCRAIVPVDLVEDKGWFGRYRCYIEPTRMLGLASGVIVLGYVGQKMLSSSPVLSKEFKPGYDPTNFFKDLFLWPLIGMVLLATIGWLGFLAYRGMMKYRSKSPGERLKYLLSDAKIRGLTNNLYESESIIDFLNARYALKIGKDPFRVWNEPFFKRNGDIWIVGYMGKRLCLKEKAGHPIIAHLLSRPNEEFPCTLFGKANPDDIDTDTSLKVEPDRFDEYDNFYQQVRGQKADKNKMEASLSLLMECREDARSDGQTDEAIRYTDQIEMMERYIRETYTKSGEEKPPRDISTKARDASKKAIERCISDVKKENPFLAEHLSKNITRSYSVSYHPPQEIHWDVQI